MKATTAAANSALGGLKAELDGGRMYWFAGTVPENAGDALNMATTHTELVEFTESGGGVVGLTFAAPSGGSMSINPAEDWTGLIDFDGFVAGPGTLTPTFFRMGEPGDNCRGATSAVRIQGTIGGPASAEEIKLVSGTTLTDNGSNTQTLELYSITQSFLA